MSSLPSYTVRTFKGFLTALERSTATRITLDAVIPVAYLLTIPERHTIVTGGHGFVKHGAGQLIFNGTLEAEHRQVFFGFSPGDITGTFRQPVVRPVWWGAYGRTSLLPAAGADTRDDIAINSAIQSVPSADTIFGRKILLDSGAYHVGRPIDLSGRNSILEGAGPNRTFIVTTTQWTCDEWKNDPMYGIANHGAVIWAGGAAPQSVQSYNSSVNGIYVNGVYAASAHLASGKRVSGISTYGWMEEHTSIENVTVEGFSGYGVGATSALSPPDPPTNPNLQRVMNGFALRKFWITTGMSPTCLPVAIGMQSAAASVRDGSIDMNPGTTRQLVHVGIWAQGKHTVIENVHMEHVRHGVMIRGSKSQLQAVGINGVDLLYGHDHDMASPPTTSPPTVVTTTKLATYSPGSSDFADLFKWSSVVSIIGEPVTFQPSCLTGFAANDQIIAFHPRVIAQNLGAESAKYLVRDYGMGQHIQSWGTAQGNAHSGMLCRYSRSSIYRPFPDNATPYWQGGAVGTYPNDGKTYASIQT